MQTVNMHQAKTHLSRLVDQAATGESVIIAKAGKPMAQLVALDAPISRPPRRRGFLAGQFNLPEGFDFDSYMQDEIIALFEGKDDGSAER